MLLYSVFILLLLLAVGKAVLKFGSCDNNGTTTCDMPDKATFVVAETISAGLVFNDTVSTTVTTYKAFTDLIDAANHSIYIVSFYWNMFDTIFNETNKEGRNIMIRLKQALKRGITIKIIQDKNQYNRRTIYNLRYLESGGASVVLLNMSKFYPDYNAHLHTKLIIIDELHMFLGSANMDWRSFTQTKEIGVILYNCSSIVGDAMRIFNLYLYFAEDGLWPAPPQYKLQYNMYNPASVYLNGTLHHLYLTVSPELCCAAAHAGSTNDTTLDLTAIVSVIGSASKHVLCSTLSYLPLILPDKHSKKYYFPFIDTAFRTAVTNNKNAKVKLLTNKTTPIDYQYLKSLTAIHGIDVKQFSIPPYTEGANITFRSHHHKFLVIDNKTVYVSTNNFGGDYYDHTAGVGLVISAVSTTDISPVVKTFTDIFNRDWNSMYVL